MPRWWIYYGDGRIFSYKDGTPFEVPRTDVQIILQDSVDSPSGLCLTYDKTWYYWDAGWWPTDELTSWLQDCPPRFLQILRGKNCKRFPEIKQQACAYKAALIEGSAA